LCCIAILRYYSLYQCSPSTKINYEMYVAYNSTIQRRACLVRCLPPMPREEQYNMIGAFQTTLKVKVMQQIKRNIQWVWTKPALHVLHVSSYVSHSCDLEFEQLFRSWFCWLVFLLFQHEKCRFSFMTVSCKAFLLLLKMPKLLN